MCTLVGLLLLGFVVFLVVVSVGISAFIINQNKKDFVDDNWFGGVGQFVTGLALNLVTKVANKLYK